jgi:hypothetical protein
MGYIAPAGERDRRHTLKVIRNDRKPDQRVSWKSLLQSTPILSPRKKCVEPGKN